LRLVRGYFLAATRRVPNQRQTNHIRLSQSHLAPVRL
jgi:hypothetical protein